VSTTRVVLIAVGVVAVAAVAKKWFTPGGVYVASDRDEPFTAAGELRTP
jgi:hypothetical protein